jgi:serine/threonine-protein kinase
MTRLLELRVGDRKTVEWSDVRGRVVRVDEDTPIRIAGDWEPGTEYSIPGNKTALPNRTWLSGRLYVREGRVYGRFTAAHTPSGVVYPVCVELLDTSNDVGLELQPGSGPGRMMVAPTARVRVVDHFE